MGEKYLSSGLEYLLDCLEQYFPSIFKSGHTTQWKREWAVCFLPETDAAGPNQAGELREHHFPAPKPGGTPPKLRSSGLEHRIRQLKSQPPTFASLFTLSSSGNSHGLKVRFHFNNREGSMLEQSEVQGLAPSLPCGESHRMPLSSNSFLPSL